MKSKKDWLAIVPALFLLASVVLLITGLIKNNEALGALSLVSGMFFVFSGIIIANYIED